MKTLLGIVGFSLITLLIMKLKGSYAEYWLAVVRAVLLSYLGMSIEERMNTPATSRTLRGTTR